MGYTLPSIIKRFTSLFILMQISLTIALDRLAMKILKITFFALA